MGPSRRQSGRLPLKRVGHPTSLLLTICLTGHISASAIGEAPITSFSTVVSIAPTVAIKPTIRGSSSQQRDRQAELAWPHPWLSEIPVVDLSGTWRFDPAISDPMVEVWRDREVLYRIEQHSGQMLMVFEPADGLVNRRLYRWGSETKSFNRDEVEVRERTRWIAAGRTFEVIGRWWPINDPRLLGSYRLLYEIASGMLVVTQEDDHGETVWRFRRHRAGDGSMSRSRKRNP